MSWTVAYSAKSKEDLRSIYKYIANKLQSKTAAVNTVTKIMDAVESLDEMPLRYKRFQEEPWFSRGLRRMEINNYCVLYLPNENNKTVEVIRILYSRRNIAALLQK